MTSEERRMKSLFADLGRPTLRGIRKCPKCGTVNGTRGSACKNKECDVVFRRGKTRRNKDTALDAVQLLGLPGYNDVYFSIRCKDRGKDHRNFVVMLSSPEVSPGGTTAQKYKCWQDTCSKNGDHPCVHIVSAQSCTSQAEPLQIKQSVFSSINIPPHHLNAISFGLQSAQLLIQRVSKTAFVIALETCDEPGDKNRVEMVHSIFSKPSKSETNIERIFYCSCTAMKHREENTTSSDPFHMMCLHFYISVCAFASNDALMKEFEQIIPQATPETTSPLLSQFHFVSNDGKSVELDSNLSVEIMQENLSLLEMSISAPDENTLSNVQALEGVLTDPIIVANVEDALSFGDGTVLDALDDEHQVCHIFSNPQGTIHLTYPSSQPQQLSDGASATRTHHIFEAPSRPPQQELNNGTSDGYTDNHMPAKKRKVCRQQDGRSGRRTPPKIRRSPTPILPSKELHSIEDESVRINSEFEAWLGGVNDRINATMNYQLPAQPDSLVYYIPAVYFDFLKERLTSPAQLVGGKKKRLPNQTFVFQRIDKAPIGSFTKHIWKITNIMHVMSVFESSVVRLKTKQYFLKSNNGNFVEWMPPANDTENNPHQRILPVLHSTHLKCGRNYPYPSKESIPFTIEWVPEIFRASKLGELSIRFEFFKSEPIVELGREISL